MGASTTCKFRASFRRCTCAPGGRRDFRKEVFPLRSWRRWTWLLLPAVSYLAIAGAWAPLPGAPARPADTKAAPAVGNAGAQVSMAAPEPAPGPPADLEATRDLDRAITEVLTAADTAAAAGQASLPVQVLAASDPELQRLSAAVRDLGGQVTFKSRDLQYLQAEMPPTAIGQLVAERGPAILAPDWSVRARVASGDPVPAAAAGSGMRLNLETLRVTAAAGTAAERGQGILVAVVDSGIDPAHPDLQSTPEGRPKLVDWQDFSGEGEVLTPEAVAGDGGELPTSLGRFLVPSELASRAGLRFGVLREGRLGGPAAADYDFNHNGRRTEEFGVLLVPDNQGTYGTVYVDTNRDFDFGDEQPLLPFVARQQFARLGLDISTTPADDRTPFVVTRVAADGSGVWLGFDGLGHGTHVAGVLAASGPEVTGVAPGAQLMALKAVGSNGQGGWFNLVQAMEYAAARGAQIINLSLEDLQAAAGNQAAASAVLRRLGERLGVLVVLAAGNGGPGAGSSLVPGDAGSVLAVGGYYSPEIWERDFGYRLPLEGLWARSAAGPRADGSLVPNVVAPVSAPAPAPTWQAATGYQSRSGTSVAAPHAAGAGAVLLAAARRQGRTADAKLVIRALEMGARALDGYQPFEQGHGLINLDVSLQHLPNLPPILPLQAQGPGGGPGLYAREYVPGRMNLVLTNRGSALQVNLAAGADWLLAEQQSLVLPAGGARTAGVQFRPPERPGIYSTFLTVRAPDRYGYDLDVPVTVIVPHQVDANGRLSLREPRLPAGRNQRYFVRVPAGTGRLNLRFAVERAMDLSPLGRAQVYLFRPDGEEAYRSPVLGAGSQEGAVAPAAVLQPVPGTWEVLVRSDTDLVRYSANSFSRYELDVSLALAHVDGSTAAPVNPVGQTPRQAQAAFTPDGSGTAPALILSYPKGGFTATEDITIRSLLDQFVGSADGGGLAPAGTLPALSGVYAAGGQVERLEVADFVPLARFQVTSLGSSPEVGLSLYRYNRLTQKLELFDKAMDRGAGHRVIEVRDLPPGTYSVYVDVPSGEFWSVRYEYRRQYFRLDGLRVEDRPRLHGLGDRWNVRTSIDVPEAPGRYDGHLFITDAQSGRILSLLRLVVSVGEPQLTARVLEPYWVQGQPGWATLEISSQDQRQPYQGTIMVSGVRYQVEGGRLAIALPASRVALDLNVEVTAPGSAPLRLSRRLTAGDQPTVAPVGIPPAPLQEWTDWRRKLFTQVQSTFAASDQQP